MPDPLEMRLRKPWLRTCWFAPGSVLSPILLLWLFALGGRAFPQAAPAQVGGLEMITVGGTFSSYRLNYGNRLILGAAVYVDVDYNHHFGIEAEGRRLWLRQRDGVRAATWLVGPRYSFNGLVNGTHYEADEGAAREKTRFRPYAKLLVGFGQFHFPYGYADGTYFVLAPGGGVDYRLSRRFRLRLIDVEYQAWPQFTYGTLSAMGISSGVRVRIF